MSIPATSRVSFSSDDELPPLPIIPLLKYGKLGVKKVVKFHPDCDKENTQLLNTSQSDTPSSPQKIKKNYDQDRKWIQDALGKKNCSSLDEFHKNHMESKFTLMKAISLKIAEVRESNQETAKGKLGIQNWKFVVQLDADKKISKLVVGRFEAEGSLTKVYLTLNNQAILIPKKGEASNQELLRSHQFISELHKIYEKMEDFAKETDGIFQKFGFSKEELIRFLPPKTEMVQVGVRPILIAPQATCLSDVIQKAPTSFEDVINRIDMFVQVSLGVALLHKAGFVHGDLKPENMLKGFDGVVRPHDLGGGDFFFASDDLQKASTRLSSMTRTAIYMHYEDYYRLYFTEMNKDDYRRLGRAGDVFALGVSLIEALRGLKYENGEAKYPFGRKCYVKYENKSFVYHSYEWERFSCVAEISPEVNENLTKLLNNVLDPCYKNRVNIIEFISVLNLISFSLKKALEKHEEVEA